MMWRPNLPDGCGLYLEPTRKKEMLMASIREEKIALQVADGTSMNAYVVAPEDGTKLPGMLVFQEIFGVNQHIRDVAARFANEGITGRARLRSGKSGAAAAGGDFVLWNGHRARASVARCAAKCARAFLLGRP